MNVFSHRYSRRFVSLNYKVMYTFFNQSTRFSKKYAGDHLKQRNLIVAVDAMLVRNPFEKLASFYSDKIISGNCISLKSEFVSLLSRKFGFEVTEVQKEKIADKISIDDFIEALEDLFMGEAHLYPQTYCLKWIRPKAIIKIESDLPKLAEMFPDIDFSVKKNESKTKTVLDEKSKSKVMRLYRDDFLQFYPELVG